MGPTAHRNHRGLCWQWPWSLRFTHASTQAWMFLMFPSILGMVEVGLVEEGAFGATASSDQILRTTGDQEWLSYLLGKLTSYTLPFCWLH